VTDTVPLREGAPDNIIQLSVAPLLAQSIEAIFTNRPISDVFQGQNQPF
jgi:ribose-phosphate pyrophosphokinase